MATTRLFTAEDLAALGPEASSYELDMGDLTEVSSSFGDASVIALNITAPLRMFVRRGKLGVVFGADGGFLLTRNPDTVRSPDGAFIRRERIPPGHNFRSFTPIAPDLAIEVLSSSNTHSEIERKIAQYFAAGTTLIWIAQPLRQSVEVVRPGEERRLLRMGDVLDGEEVIPGFHLPLTEVFELLD